MTSPVRYRPTLLRAGEFRLDGGSMFGLIPRSVWSRACTPDDKGRITVQHNCLLLERLDAAPADWKGPASGLAPKLALLEVGTGDKLDEKNREIFAMQPRSILDALHEVACKPEDIGAAVISHLHFDHAGALTRLAHTGETPDWTGPASSFGAPRPDHGVKLTFPNAKAFVQARELVDARNNTSVMTRTYFADHLEPTRSQIVTVDSAPPFAPGYTPTRAETPLAPVDLRLTEVLPGVFVFRVPGHTWGQQAMLFTDPKGRTVVFVPDVMPTAWHVGAAYSLGYDVEPYTSMVSRTWLLNEAADRGWILVLDHEPGNPVRRAVRNNKGWFDLVEDSL